MATGLDRLLAVMFGTAFVILAAVGIVWLPDWWGLLFAPALVWLGWLLVAEVINRSQPQTAKASHPVAREQTRDDASHPRRKLAA